MFSADGTPLLQFLFCQFCRPLLSLLVLHLLAEIYFYNTSFIYIVLCLTCMAVIAGAVGWHCGLTCVCAFCPGVDLPMIYLLPFGSTVWAAYITSLYAPHLGLP